MRCRVDAVSAFTGGVIAGVCLVTAMVASGAELAAQGSLARAVVMLGCGAAGGYVTWRVLVRGDWGCRRA